MTGDTVRNFECVALVPCGPERPAIAVEAAQTGAIAVLDLAHFVPEAGGRGHTLLDQISWVADRLVPTSRFGLRVDPGLDEIEQYLAFLSHFDSTLILADALGTDEEDWQRLPQGCRLLAETRSVDAYERLMARGLRIDGVIACGNECAGVVGEDSTFILVQKLLPRARAAVYARGGIGPYSAGACRAAGVNGVVLDDQLLLLPGSPLRKAWKQSLLGPAGNETAIVGEDAGCACRIFDYPGFPAVSGLKWLGQQCSGRAASDEWRNTVQEVVGWGPPDKYCWPVGQSITVGKRFALRFSEASQIVRHIMQESARCVATAHDLRPLAAGASLAVSHRTRFPIVQGPMTRVSDRPGFAAAVAEAGALPMIALAMLRGWEARPILEQTRDRLGDLPWGVGILGFVPPEIRDEQIQEILHIRPPFALIAGGRADLALSLEREGIATYLHTPLPSLLRNFLAGGARRFVFEGRECGGHVGPLCSFPLWDCMVEALLAAIPAGEEESIHVLFAGGIHDELSAAMAAALAAPLALRGVRSGVLMGTAYLFTDEAVSSGAIVADYQRRALECRATVLLTSGVGHSNRVALTPFAEAFEAHRRKLQESATPPDAIRADLEQMMLGNLRLASKGLTRNARGELAEAPAWLQSTGGVYMMGAAATVRSEICPMADLHREVSEGSCDLLAGAAQSLRDLRSDSSGVAIIGMAALLPGARSAPRFWRNMLDWTEAIRDLPPERWDITRIFDLNRSARNKTYAKVGGFVDDIPFDPLQYRIPPGAMRSISTTQLLALEVTRWALADCGYLDREFARDSTAVIFGTNGGGSMLSERLNAVTLAAEVADGDPGSGEPTPQWTSETFPGILANVTAGRVANHFDLGGPNYAVDAACASSLLAVELACRELETGRSDMVICGGIDTTQTPSSYVAFSKTQALSPTGRARVFDKSADGIVISEGACILVMKRLEDAERDGDRIYAVIRGTGSSSDGRGLGITVPKGEGQRLAIERALRQAAFTADTIGVYEAHGTGTPLGDGTELDNWVRLLAEAGAPPYSCAVGSAKALIGHTKTAAGVTGLVKAALALYHRSIPPQSGIADPLDCLANPTAPIYTVDRPRPWISPLRPRRAAVSAFGFGGTNTHIVLEEFQRPSGAALGAEEWPCELFLFGGEDREGLQARMRTVQAALERGSQPEMRELAFALAREFEEHSRAVFASIVAADSGALQRALSEAIDAVQRGVAPASPTVATGLANDAGALAFLFPGQGSQYPGMGWEAMLYLHPVREALERAEAEIALQDGHSLSAFIYPPAAFDPRAAERQRQELADTRHAQPALGALSAGLLALLEELGVRADMAAGHSYGELVALHAGGALSRSTLFHISELRGRVMGECGDGGGMLSVQAPREVVAALVEEIEGLVVSNHNGPRQTVVSGTGEAIEALAAAAARLNLRTTKLPVGSAFHSPLLAGALEPWAARVAELDLRPLRIPVYANLDGRPYPAAPSAVRVRLKEHLLRPVEFAAQVEEMYAAGVRLFVEVGPENVLTRLVAGNLGDRPHTAIALDPQRGRLQGLLCAIGALAVRGAVARPSRLFEFRGIEPAEVDEVLDRSSPAPPPALGWWVNGTYARPMHDTRPIAPADPFVTSIRAVSAATTNSGKAGEFPPLSLTPGGTRPDILGAYAAYQETMRRFLDVEERALATFLELCRTAGDAEAAVKPPLTLVSQPGEPQEPDSAPELVAGRDAPAEASPKRGGTPSADDVKRELLSIVSSCTGYPPETLGLDADLEADLGIDSLRRIQIVETLLTWLSENGMAAGSSQMDPLLQVRTLNQIVATVLPAVVAPHPPAEPESDKGAGTTTSPVCPRFVSQGYPRSLEPRPDVSLPGSVLITEDELGVAEAAIGLLQDRGIPAKLIPQSILSDSDGTADFVGNVSESIGAIVHLSPLVNHGAPNYPEWRTAAQIQAKSLFQILSHAARRFAASGAPSCRILGATNMGGDFGRGGRMIVTSPLGGAGAGLLKTVSLEWPAASVKVLDFDAAAPREIARLVIAELLSDQDLGLEIGYPAGARTVFTTVARPHQTPTDHAQFQPRADWVVLATGGSRGITAEILLTLTRPGMTLILAGASPEPEDAAESDDGEDESAIRDRLISAARKNDEVVSPARIEARLREVVTARERRRTIQRLTAAGARVYYRQCDVRRSDDVEQMLSWIYEHFGGLDAVLHGAGVIEDKLVAQKRQDAFDRVFDTKVDGAFLLARNIDMEQLKLFVLFGSVAGRFGNAGQADYAAANEVLNRFAWGLSGKWPQIRVMCINWGPWESSGMATAAARARFAERGIVPIEARAGCRFFAEELELGRREDVEVIAGEGPWRKSSARLDGVAGALIETAPTAGTSLGVGDQ